MRPDLAAAAAALRALPPQAVHGVVTGLGGLAITLEGFGPLAAIGDRLRLEPPAGERAEPYLQGAWSLASNQDRIHPCSNCQSC